MLNVKMRMGLLLAAICAAFILTGCGHSEDEWQAAQRDIAKLKADLDAANKRHADDEQKYADDQQQIEDLKAKLKDLGVGLSKSEEEKSKLRTAMDEYAKTIQFAEEAHDPRRVAWARYKTGELLREERRFDEADQNLRSAREIFTEIGDRVGLSMTIKVEGQMALDHGDLPLAESRLLEAHRLLKGLRHTLEEIDVVLQLAHLANARGDRANAERHVVELERLRLSALRPDLVKEFAELRRSIGAPGGSGGQD